MNCALKYPLYRICTHLYLWYHMYMLKMYFSIIIRYQHWIPTLCLFTLISSSKRPHSHQSLARAMTGHLTWMPTIGVIERRDNGRLSSGRDVPPSFWRVGMGVPACSCKACDVLRGIRAWAEQHRNPKIRSASSKTIHSCTARLTLQDESWHLSTALSGTRRVWYW